MQVMVEAVVKEAVMVEVPAMTIFTVIMTEDCGGGDGGGNSSNFLVAVMVNGGNCWQWWYLLYLRE